MVRSVPNSGLSSKNVDASNTSGTELSISILSQAVPSSPRIHAPQSQAQKSPITSSPRQLEYKPTPRSWEQSAMPGLISHAHSEPILRNVSQLVAGSQPQPQSVPVQEKFELRPPPLQRHTTPQLPVKQHSVLATGSYPQPRSVPVPQTFQSHSPPPQRHITPQLPANQHRVGNDRRSSTNHFASVPSQPRSLTSNGKSFSSIFAAANAKTLTKNKWIRSTATFGANIVMKAVIGDAASSLFSSNNSDSYNGNDNDNDGGDFLTTAGSLWNGLGVGSSSSGAQDPPFDTGSEDGSTGVDITGNFNDNDSATANNSNNYDWTDSNASTTDSGLIDANPNPSIFDTNSSFVSLSISPSLTVTSMDSPVDASFLTPNLSSTSLETTINDPNPSYAIPASPIYSQGDQTSMLDYDNTQDNLQNAQDGLLNSEEGLDGAIDQGSNDAINQGNVVDADMQNNFYASLGEGDPAEPDVDCSDQDDASDGEW